MLLYGVQYLVSSAARNLCLFIIFFENKILTAFEIYTMTI